MHLLHHKGNIAELAGAQLWIASIAVIFLRDLGYHIPIYWALDGWVIGLLLIAWGTAWALRKDVLPASDDVEEKCRRARARTEELTREPATKDR